MTSRLTRSAYERLIEEDVARVLAEMQPSPERAHVVEVLRASAEHEYRALPVLRCERELAEAAQSPTMQDTLAQARRGER